MKTRDIIMGLAAALVLAIAVSPFASSSPDGLEKVAEDKGFVEKGGGQPLLPSPIPDYSMPGVKGEGLATSLGGAAGTLLVFGLGMGTAALIGRQGRKS